MLRNIAALQQQAAGSRGGLSGTGGTGEPESIRALQ
jgi:hypothetical protein